MRIIVGVTGASGSLLAVRFLQALQAMDDVETHLVVSDQAVQTLELELQLTVEALTTLAQTVYPVHDLAAPIASGSFDTAGMVVIPCSMKTLAGIVHGYSDNLLLRSADVCMKERRKLVLVTREMPLSPVHLENMWTASIYGAIIMPPVLTFYQKPQTIDDMIDHLIGKIFLQFGLSYAGFQRWDGPSR